VKARIPLLVDTQEKTHGHEWKFDSELFDVTYRTLETGDYTVAGLEHALTIERKSLGDAVGTVIHDWTRFRKQLYRMAGMDLAVVVIESSVAAILDHEYESDAEPLSVLGRLNSVTIDHGVPVVYAGSRACAETWAERFLVQVVKKRGGVS
jgi:ERCC4-type nuclease